MARHSTRLNLIVDGPRQIAAAFAEVLAERGRERYHLYVDATGRVRWPQAASTRNGRIRPIPKHDLVGIYDQHSSSAAIEADLARRLQLITRCVQEA